MKPENTPRKEEENHLPKPSFSGFMLIFGGVIGPNDMNFGYHDGLVGG